MQAKHIAVIVAAALLAMTGVRASPDPDRGPTAASRGADLTRWIAAVAPNSVSGAGKAIAPGASLIDSLDGAWLTNFWASPRPEGDAYDDPAWGILRFDDPGGISFARLYRINGRAGGFIRAVRELPAEGRFLFAGDAFPGPVNPCGAIQDGDGILLALDGTGHFMEGWSLSTPGSDMLSDVRPQEDGTALLAGGMNGQLWMARLAGGGRAIWERGFEFPLSNPAPEDPTARDFAKITDKDAGSFYILARHLESPGRYLYD